MVKTCYFHCYILGLDPGLGTEIPHQAATCCSQKKKKYKYMPVDLALCMSFCSKVTLFLLVTVSKRVKWQKDKKIKIIKIKNKRMKWILKNCPGVPLWLSKLRVWHCQCSSLGRCCSSGLNPGNFHLP